MSSAVSFELRPWALSVSVFLTVSVCCSQAAGAPVDELLKPCAVAYECVTALSVGNAVATWKLSFDRRHAGVYDIVHWQLVFTDGRRAEYLAHLQRPGIGPMYYTYFVRERRGIWYTLGIRKRWVWREVATTSPERGQMAVRLQQLLAAAKALRDGADPKSVKF